MILPAALRPLTEQRRWVIWFWTMRKDSRGDIQWTKAPRQISGRNASSKSHGTWATYADALAAKQRLAADGIGYMLLNDPLKLNVLDLDGCRDPETGEISGWAEPYVVQAEELGAYVEVTPSGTGLRVIGTTSTNAPLHRRFSVPNSGPKAGIEIYRNTATGRYITITGWALNGGCITSNPEALTDGLLAEYDKPAPTKAVNDAPSIAPVHNGSDRSADFHAEVWRLASQGRTIAEITQDLRQHPAADKYGYRLTDEIVRSYGKWQEKHKPTSKPEEPERVPVIKSSKEFVAGFVPPDYIVDGLLQQGFLYSLTGATGAGKTAITLRLAASTALQIIFAGRETKKLRVLYLAAENPDDVRMRWIALSQHMGFDDQAIEVYWVEGCFKISQMTAKLKAEAEKRGGEFGLVVVDTSPAFFEGDDENSRAQMGVHARTLRGLIDAIPGRPCVIANCHPVKNATADNLLPAGGGTFLNEVDGNLTAAKNDSTTELHWQGKFRGPEFAPMHFLIKTVTHQDIKDSKGRLVPTVICEWISDQCKEEITAQKSADETKVLGLIDATPTTTHASIAIAMEWKLYSGEPNKMRAKRCIDLLKKDKLVKEARNGKLKLTPEGKKALAGDSEH